MNRAHTHSFSGDRQIQLTSDHDHDSPRLIIENSWDKDHIKLIYRYEYRCFVF